MTTFQTIKQSNYATTKKLFMTGFVQNTDSQKKNPRPTAELAAHIWNHSIGKLLYPSHLVLLVIAHKHERIPKSHFKDNLSYPL